MAYAEPPADAIGDVYGDLNDSLELQVVQNPYYGGEVEANQNDIRPQNTDRNDMEMITSRQNDYYEM